MTQFLRVKIMNLKGAVVNMVGWIGADEKAMMVHVILATIYMSEKGHLLLLAAFTHVQKVAGYYVEGLGIEVDHSGKFRSADTVVSQLPSQSVSVAKSI